jgi:hypothetical protein
MAKTSILATMTILAAGAVAASFSAPAMAATNPAEACLHGNGDVANTMKNSCAFAVTVYYQPTSGPGSSRDEVKSVDLAPHQSKRYGLSAEQLANTVVAAICPLHQKPYVGLAPWYANMTAQEAVGAHATLSTSPGLIEINYECRA